MKQNKVLRVVVVVLVGWLLYTITFNTAGEFEPIFDLDVVHYRLGVAVGAIADDTERSIKETNENMQGVVDDRGELNRDRVRRDVHGE